MERSFGLLCLRWTVRRKLCPLSDQISNTFIALIQFPCVVGTPNRDTEKSVAIDDALMQHVADLADPVVDVHFGTTQAQRRFTAHRHAMCALSTVQTSVFDIAHLLRITTCEHLLHEGIIVGLIVTRM